MINASEIGEQFEWHRVVSGQTGVTAFGDVEAAAVSETLVVGRRPNIHCPPVPTLEYGGWLLTRRPWTGSTAADSSWTDITQDGGKLPAVVGRRRRWSTGKTASVGVSSTRVVIVWCLCHSLNSRDNSHATSCPHTTYMYAAMSSVSRENINKPFH